MCIIGGLDMSNIESAMKYRPDMVAICNGIFNQDKDRIKAVSYTHLTLPTSR